MLLEYDLDMNKKRFIKIFLVTIIALIVWGFIWSWFITRTVRINSKNDAFKSQHAIVKNIIVTETQEGKKYWEFYAKSGEYDSNDTSITLNDVIGNFYDKDENVEVSFKSKKGTYDEKTKKVILNGDNLFVGKDGSQLYADKLVWQGRDEDILADGNVQLIKTNEYVVKSQSAVFNSSLTHFKIKGNTKTLLYFNENDKKKYTQM